MDLQLAQDDEYLGDDTWRWSVWLDVDEPTLQRVSWVEYHLHSTFATPVRRVTDRDSRFRLDARGWGVFELRANVRLDDDTTVELRHMLELAYPDESDPDVRRAPTRGLVQQTDEPARRTVRPRARKVFLSAGSADAEVADGLRSSLAERGVEVWSEVDLPSGEAWGLEIERAIAESDAVVAVTSDVRSTWVEREVGVALNQKARVIPVVVGEDAVVPSSLDSLAQIRVDDLSDVDDAAHSIMGTIETDRR